MGGYSSRSPALLYLQITKGRFPAPCRLPRRDFQREGMGFQVGTLRLCYRLIPGEAALGSSAGGKLPLRAAQARRREASRLAWCSGIPILLTFGGISEGLNAGPQKILLWLIAVTLKAKPEHQKKERSIASVWLTEEPDSTTVCRQSLAIECSKHPFDSLTR